MRRHVPREENLIFLKSWNEWAEGNHLEPDLKFGKGYLEVIKEEVLAACKVANVVQGANLAAEMVVSGSD